MENLITEFLTMIHPQHFLIMQVKKELALRYGNTEKSLMSNLTEKQLERKLQLCQEWLEVMGKVDRGFTLSRGRILEEVVKVKLEKMKRIQGTKLQLIMEMKKVGKFKQFETEEEQREFASRAKTMILF